MEEVEVRRATATGGGDRRWHGIAGGRPERQWRSGGGGGTE